MEIDDYDLARKLQSAHERCVAEIGRNAEICIVVQIASDFLDDVRIGIMRDSDDLFVPMVLRLAWSGEHPDFFENLTSLIERVKVSQRIHSELTESMLRIHSQECILITKLMQADEAQDPGAVASTQLRSHIARREFRRKSVHPNIM